MEAKKKLGKAKVAAPMLEAKAVEAERRRVEALKRAGLHHEDGPMQYAREASLNAKSPATLKQATSLSPVTAYARVPVTQSVELSDGTSVRIMRLGVNSSVTRSGNSTTNSKLAPTSRPQSWTARVFDRR
jgi:hypothetical protein